MAEQVCCQSEQRADFIYELAGNRRQDICYFVLCLRSRLWIKGSVVILLRLLTEIIILCQDKKTEMGKRIFRNIKITNIQIQFLGFLCLQENAQDKLVHYNSQDKMGNSQNKDSRVRLYLTTTRPLIYAGQYLQATAHLEVLQDAPYQSINLSFVGNEKVQWSETIQKLLLSHKNERQTYHQELVLDTFEDGLKKGQYSFPFNILIPSSLPASMRIDENNYIAYYLTVYLPAYDSASQTQAFSLSLHIREPLRSIFNTVSEGTTISKCCGCFDNQKSGLFHIQVDRNEIHYTDKFKVRCFVDNTKGQFSFQQICLVLTRRITRISESEAVQNIEEDVGVFYRSKKPLFSGSRKKFEIELNLPQRIIEYTAIGNILSRSYYISLVGQVGCCYNNVKIQKHMVLNNQVPPAQYENLKQKQPENWKPQVKPSISFVSLKPYIYSPSPQITVQNQKGNVAPSSVVNLQLSSKSLYRTQ